MPATPPHVPNACARRPGSVYRACSRVSEEGTDNAAPAPWMRRAATRNPADGASAQAAEASVNSTGPAWSTRFGPTRSPSVPALSSSPAKTRVYPATTHCRVLTPACRSWPIAGTATLTTIVSRITMKYPGQMISSAMHPGSPPEPSSCAEGCLSGILSPSGAIAQLEEHLVCIQGVRGSNPLSSTQQNGGSPSCR
jgi:hypothetical protein